jgi:hypothetical protein
MRHKLLWVSVPFQFNWYQHVGPLELSTFILNVQPVIPLKVNDDWNLILGIIVRSSASRLCLTDAAGSSGRGAGPNAIPHQLWFKFRIAREDSEGEPTFGVV